jgi:uncharacterized protein
MEKSLTPADLNGRTKLLVLQGSPFCNIDCDYCYLARRDDRQQMPLDLVERTVTWIYQTGLAADDLTIAWHAGEPLVLAPGWYEEAFARAHRAAPRRARIRHAFQTNGLLINDAWCDFFLGHNVSLGVSLDGPAPLHDAHRRTRSGRGTHSRVMSGISILQRRSVPFHIIAVVSEQTLTMGDAFVDFFLENDIHEVGINIEEIEGQHRKSTLERAEIRKQFRVFFEQMIDRAHASGRLYIREFWRAFDVINEPVPSTGNDENTPFSIVSVSVDGRISTFSPELLDQSDPMFGDFSVGQIDRSNLTDILANPRFIALNAQISKGIDACRDSCAYFAVCGGGAPSNKLGELGDFGGTETLFCRLTTKEITEVVLARLSLALSRVSKCSSAEAADLLNGAGGRHT